MRINNKGKGIYFHALKLPKDLQGRGIGRFCVDWLKDFSQKYGFEYIALGSYKRAELTVQSTETQSLRYGRYLLSHSRRINPGLLFFKGYAHTPYFFLPF